MATWTTDSTNTFNYFSYPMVTMTSTVTKFNYPLATIPITIEMTPSSGAGAEPPTTGQLWPRGNW